MQNKKDYTGLLAISEELKTYPWGDVWDAFCERENVPERESWLKEVREYEVRTAERLP
jgi:L-rhamnose isomerase